MVNPNKVLALWWGRVIFLAVLSAPFAEFCFEILGLDSFWFAVPFLLSVFLLLFYFYLRSRSLALTIDSQSIAYTVGVIFRRKITIKSEHILGGTRFSTPLSKKLKLCNFYISCEGAGFLIFPLSENVTDILEAMISCACLTSSEKEPLP